MTGLPPAGEYRLAQAPLPGSSLILESMEFKGLDSAAVPVASRVQDPGSFRLQLTFRDIDAPLAALSAAGSRTVTEGGTPVRMTFGGRPWRLAVVPDPNNLFLIVQPAPLPAAPTAPSR